MTSQEPNRRTTSSATAWRDRFGVQNAGVFYALILIVGGFGITTSLSGKRSYLSLGNAESVLQQTSIVGLLAVFTTVVLITGNFDLSIASTAALTSVAAIRLGGHIPTPLLVLLCLGIGLLVGAVNATLVVLVRVNAFIATLGTQQVVRGAVYLVAGQISVLGDVGDLRAMTNTVVAVSIFWFGLVVAAAVVVIGLLRLRRARRNGARGPDLAPALILLIVGVVLALVVLLAPRQTLSLYTSVYLMLAVGVLTWAVLAFTVIGRRLYAVGSNTEAALLAGIRVKRYQAGAFMVNGLAAGFAGLMIAGQYQAVDPTVFTGAEFICITGAILGGTSLFGGAGNVLKSIVGAIIVIALGNALNFQNVSSQWQFVVQGAALVVAATIYVLGGNPGTRRRRRRDTPSTVSTATQDPVTNQDADPVGAPDPVDVAPR